MTEPPFATGGEVRSASPIRIGGAGCTIPARATCECGREIHITVNLSTAQIEAAVSRVLGDMQRKAAQWAAHRAPIGG